MRKFVNAGVFHGEAFIGTGEGDVWRVWFGHDGLPLMEHLTDTQLRDYAEATGRFAKAQGRGTTP